MAKKILIILILFCSLVPLSGCTSRGSQDDSESAQANNETFGDEGEGDFADEDGADASASDGADADPSEPIDEGADVAANDSEGAGQVQDSANDSSESELGPEDELTLDDGTEEGVDSLASDDPSDSPSDQANNANGTPTNEPTDSPTDAPTDEPLFTEPAAEPTPAPVAQSEPTQAVEASAASPDDGSTGAVKAEDVATAPARPVFAPLLKMKDSAFTAAGGTTLNRVYLGRPGDKVKTVSEKIYGTPNRTKDLIAWNPFLKRGVRTGDKIYYASPTNPSDSRMLVYFEEMSVAPQVYVSKEGDNIRSLSKKLLGFNDAWKEVWSTNLSVESKGDLPVETELRFWPEDKSARPLKLADSGSATSPSGPSLQGARLTPPQATQPSVQAGSATDLPPPPPVAEAPPLDGSNFDPIEPEPPVDPALSQQQSSDAGAVAANPTPTDPAVNQAGTTASAGTDAGTESPPVDPLAPPPPVASGEVKPPQPAQNPAQEQPSAEPAVGLLGPEITTLLLLILGIGALVGGFVWVKKRNARRLDLGQTQV